MKAGSKQARAVGRKGKEESALTNKIELKQQCEREIKKWIKLVKSRDFPTNLKKQNEAALIARGIVIKMQVLKVERAGDDVLEEMARSIVHGFGQAWAQKSLTLVVAGPDGGPIPMEHTVTHNMDLATIRQKVKDAIKRDQER